MNGILPSLQTKCILDMTIFYKTVHRFRSVCVCVWVDGALNFILTEDSISHFISAHPALYMSGIF